MHLSNIRKIISEILVFIFAWIICICLAVMFPIVWLWFSYDQYMINRNNNIFVWFDNILEEPCVYYIEENGLCSIGKPDMDCPCCYYTKVLKN